MLCLTVAMQVKDFKQERPRLNWRKADWGAMRHGLAAMDWNSALSPRHVGSFQEGGGKGSEKKCASKKGAERRKSCLDDQRDYGGSEEKEKTMEKGKERDMRGGVL